MSKTFDTVDGKIAETEFFLQKMAHAGFEMSEFSFYFSAYLAAARSVTLALQQFKHLNGFNSWYKPHQESLKNDTLARFFLNTRNSHLHGGEYPIKGGSMGSGVTKYHFRDYENNNIKSEEDDVVNLSRRFFVTLLSIVYDCYLVLGTQIDPQQHYTKEHFDSIGRTIEQAECEIFGWSNERLSEEEDYSEDDRWDYLRSNVGSCQINHIFNGYLGRVTPQPQLPDHYEDFAYSDEEKGWIHLPAGFKSLKEWLEHVADERKTQ